MTILTIFILAIGLSFDTFAVSVSSGIARKHLQLKEALVVASVLGLFQSIMPLLGWLGGLTIKEYIESIDHWIAFGLLSIIGTKMIVESYSCEKGCEFNPLKPRILIGMAIATSIDALAVGVSFAIIEVNIILTVLIIGLVTFGVAMLGMLFGKKIGDRIGRRMEIIGGVILIAIGIRILLQHLVG